MSRLLAVLVFAFAACGVSAQDGTLLHDETLPFSRGERVEVHTSSPDVSIESWGGRGVRVRVEGSGTRVQAFFDHLRFSTRRTDWGVRIATDPGGRFMSIGVRPRVRITVMVPERADVTVRTSSGDIAVERLRGDARLSSSSGSVRLDRIDGDVVEVTSSSGRLQIGDVRARQRLSTSTSSGYTRITSAQSPAFSHRSSSGGFQADRLTTNRAQLRASSGDIRIDQMTGDTEARTSSGRITIGAAEGSLSLRASSGAIDVTLRRATTVEARSSSGSVTINVPHNHRAEVDLRGGTIDIARELAFHGDRERRIARGTINGGGPVINVRTSSGRIQLRGA